MDLGVSVPNGLMGIYHFQYSQGIKHKYTNKQKKVGTYVIFFKNASSINFHISYELWFKKIKYYTSRTVCFSPLIRQSLHLLRGKKLIISFFNLLFIIDKQTLYDYHFFQIHSFLMPFYSVIKCLWYDNSSFIQARIFHS